MTRQINQLFIIWKFNLNFGILSTQTSYIFIVILIGQRTQDNLTNTKYEKRNSCSF